MFDLNYLITEYGLRKVNTLTKYPSIETYHEIEKGKLKNNLTNNEHFPDESCYVTEKVDGTNTRIIFLNGDFLIGSREEIIYAKDDRIINPILGIVNTVLSTAHRINPKLPKDNKIRILYGETFGGNIGKPAKNYTISNKFDYKLFDIATIDSDKIVSLMEMPIEKIATWREKTTDRFSNIAILQSFATSTNIECVPYTATIHGNNIPNDRQETYEFLCGFKNTKCIIEEDYWDKIDANKKQYYGKAEGIVVRNFDRSFIRKLRFEDYEKTLKNIKGEK